MVGGPPFLIPMLEIDEGIDFGVERLMPRGGGVGFRVVPSHVPPPSADRHAANDTAYDLLCSHLDDQQLVHWNAYRRFEVELGPRTYQIAIDDPHSHTFNITLTKGTIEPTRCGCRISPLAGGYGPGTVFCIVFQEQMYGNAWLPVYDRLLAQKLVLEHNEDYFLATAVTRAVYAGG